METLNFLKHFFDPLIPLLKLGASVILIFWAVLLVIKVIKKISTKVQQPNLGNLKKLIAPVDLNFIRKIRPQLINEFSKIPWLKTADEQKAAIITAIENSNVKELRNIPWKNAGINYHWLHTFILQDLKNPLEEVYYQKERELKELCDLVSKDDMVDKEQIVKGMHFLSGSTLPLEQFKLSVYADAPRIEELLRSSQKEKSIAQTFFNKYSNPQIPAQFKEIPGITGIEDIALKDSWIDVLVYAPQKISSSQWDFLSLLRPSYGIRVWIADSGSLTHIPEESPIFCLSSEEKYLELFESPLTWEMPVAYRSLYFIENINELKALSKIDPEVGASRFTEFWNQLKNREALENISDRLDSIENLLEDQNNFLRSIEKNTNTQIRLQTEQLSYSQRQTELLARLSQQVGYLNTQTSQMAKSHVFALEKEVREMLPSGKIVRKTVKIDNYKK